MLEIAGGVVLGIVLLYVGWHVFLFLLMFLVLCFDAWRADRALARRAKEQQALAARRQFELDAAREADRVKRM